MPNLRAFILNSRLEGETFTEECNTSSRDTVKFTCDGQQFIVKTKPDGMAEVLVENVSPEQKASTLEAIDRICWLLAFATQSHVACYGHDYPDGSSLGSREAVTRAGQNVDPVIHPANGAAIRQFVDQTYPAFKAFEATRSLRVVIDYVLQAASWGLPMECKLVFLSVLLENLKHTYGVSKGIPYINGYFREAKKRDAKTIPLKKMLRKMFGEVGMVPDLQPFIDVRNAVVHSGVIAKSPTDQRVAYGAITDLIREYLLRLLGFKGTFNVSGSGGTSKTI